MSEIAKQLQSEGNPPPKAGRISVGVVESPENPVGSKGFSGPDGNVSARLETERLGNSTSRSGENPGNTFADCSGCNLSIIAELEQVRARAAQGQLPAFRRGKMVWSFHWDKVMVLPEACA